MIGPDTTNWYMSGLCVGVGVLLLLHAWVKREKR